MKTLKAVEENRFKGNCLLRKKLGKQFCQVFGRYRQCDVARKYRLKQEFQTCYRRANSNPFKLWAALTPIAWKYPQSYSRSRPSRAFHQKLSRLDKTRSWVWNSNLEIISTIFSSFIFSAPLVPSKKQKKIFDRVTLAFIFIIFFFLKSNFVFQVQKQE